MSGSNWKRVRVSSVNLPNVYYQIQRRYLWMAQGGSLLPTGAFLKKMDWGFYLDPRLYQSSEEAQKTRVWIQLVGPPVAVREAPPTSRPLVDTKARRRPQPKSRRNAAAGVLLLGGGEATHTARQGCQPSMLNMLTFRDTPCPLTSLIWNKFALDPPSLARPRYRPSPAWRDRTAGSSVRHVT